MKDFFTGRMFIFAVSLMLLFGILDYFIYPHALFELLSIRVTFAGVAIAARWFLLRHPDLDFRRTQITVGIVMNLASIAITAMPIVSGDQNSTYWCGLIMLLILLGIGLTFETRWFCALIVNITVPTSVLSLFHFYQTYDPLYLIGPIFLIGSTVLTIAGWYYLSELEKREYNHRLELAKELASREKVIIQKTEEGMRLKTLSRQFSPQVIQAIESGSISIDGKIEERDICVVFIDIKDSTQKVQVLSPEVFHKVISEYLDDVMAIMLERDMTIDKFLGDGVMGFTNAPNAQSDYELRALQVALDIQSLMEKKSEHYSSLWNGPFEYRIGIAKGRASLGFYGGSNSVRSFTAIGKVVNLASRLNGVAKTNGIVISEGLMGQAKSQFGDESLQEMPSLILKGFEKESMRFWEFLPSRKVVQV